MLSSVCYAITIISLIGTVCLTKPAVKGPKVVEQVYNHNHKLEYYNPVYVDSDTNGSEATIQTTKLVHHTYSK